MIGESSPFTVLFIPLSNFFLCSSAVTTLVSASRIRSTNAMKSIPISKITVESRDTYLVVVSSVVRREKIISLKDWTTEREIQFLRNLAQMCGSIHGLISGSTGNNKGVVVPRAVWEENIEWKLFSVQFLIIPFLETYRSQQTSNFPVPVSFLIPAC